MLVDKSIDIQFKSKPQIFLPHLVLVNFKFLNCDIWEIMKEVYLTLIVARFYGFDINWMSSLFLSKVN